MDLKNPINGARSSDSLVESLFHRRIDFHPARKPSSVQSVGGDFHLETLNAGASSQMPPVSTGALSVGKKSEGAGELVEHGLDSELSFKITYRRIGAGLENLGNTCYLNSVLQCLTYTEPFAAYLQSGKHKSSCHTAGFCAMCALQSHVMDALRSTGKILSPLHLVKNLRCISRNFRNSRQEDAHEYMVNLLESMHKCCLPSGVPSESPVAFEKSLVHKIFGGRLRSQVKCTQCSYCSNKFDPFLDLSLEITKADSLHKAFARFTAVEELDDGKKQYQCQHCKQKVRALKQLTIHKAPYVLTIHLKRFGSSIPGQKIDKRVEFGPALDLKPFLSEPHDDLKYTLYGVLVHAGWSTHSGHYYCYVRTSSGMWHSLDDKQVFQVSEKTVLAQKAYMLFYVRDRSTTTKRQVDAICKENRAENVSGHKVVSHAARQNTPLKEAASFQEKGANLPKEISISHNKSHAKLKEALALQNSNNSLTKELQTTALSKDSSNLSAITKTGSQLMMEEFLHIFQAKDSAAASRTVDVPLISNVDTNANCQNIITDRELNNRPPRPGHMVDSKHSGMTEATQKEANEHARIGNQVPNFYVMILEYDNFKIRRNFMNKPLKDSLGDCCQTAPKRRKLDKFTLERTMCFGRKQLFLSVLSLQKRKKKRCKRSRVNSRKGMKHKTGENPQSDDCGASTSKAVLNVSSNSIHSSRKQSRSPLDLKKDSEGINDVKCCNGSSMNTNKGAMEEMSNKVLSAHEQSKNFLDSSADRHKARETAVLKNADHQVYLSLLMRGLKETHVAQWDDMDSPSFQSNGSTDAGNNAIGYVPDEWDEDYDRGKMKKMKKAKRSFDGPNPFQEAANLKAQKKSNPNVNRRPSSANTPFRI
ncbi:ubiquitin carboxyl-terminal hydrolase 23 [Dioscorea cayenensis subsp. rotundata]|uniref:Ubiquitin carboxyl-terminal hydrolase n=1 Tax=Dioscorea cayennensis subsp. rotundata TaxID=55577 RepID=A0AB40ALQ0_DIOCR|nr:ubiquitin carboxyl-terminal hydrolase 23 [Dioscorea cayenensis subsp. rotundata]